MKKILFLFLFSIVGAFSFGQLNMALLDHLEYNVDLSCLWGWVDPDDGTEYALVGAYNGLSIVSLADPSNVVEVGFIPDNNSAWREVKAYGHYAYVVTESVSPTPSGVMVVDLSDAPNSFPYTHWIPNIPGLGSLNRAHTISVDEFGYLYINGSNINNGGVVIADVSANDGNPVYVGKAPAIYCHDAFIRDNRLYTSDIYAGNFSVYDVSDKTDIKLLATQQTPFVFTHNTWLNDASTVLFTTDEKANASVASYDISNLDNIVELDQFRSLPTIWTGVIPHNVHVWDDWLIVSYYTEGVIIVDGSRPDNLIEVGNFDSFVSQTSGFYGVWGVYPYYPSGIVVATDIEKGLLIYDVDYVRACWLEGTVTNAVTGLPIANASIHIESDQANEATTNLSGIYKTGQVLAGDFQATFSASGYLSKTINVSLANGVLTILDVQLEPVTVYSLSGQVVRFSDGSPIPGAQVILQNALDEYVFTADAEGNFSTAAINGGSYKLMAGAWGFLHVSANNFGVNANTQPLIVSLRDGYQDDFIFDLGWTETHTASSGWWVRDKPIGTEYNGDACNPYFDVSFDLGDKCYITGNSGGEAGDDDVDNGAVTLFSPKMDLSNYSNPVLNYSAWFYNDGGDGNPNDALQVRISNGAETVVLETITQSSGSWREPAEFNLAEFIELTDDMQVIFETNDLPNSGHLVEAAIDAFRVSDAPVYPVFSASNTQGCRPLTVEFFDSSDSTLAWVWTFEGGNPASSTLQNPVVIYDAPGTYSVNLVVLTNGNNEYAIEQTNLVVVLPEPVAAFEYSATEDKVSFTNTSQDGVTYSWDFGDNTGSTEASPVHTYTQSGTYQVSLTATNDCGTSVFGETITIQITGTTELSESACRLSATPNPFAGQLIVEYELEAPFRQAELLIFNILGEQIANIALDAPKSALSLDREIPDSGLYFICIKADGKLGKALRALKI